MRVLFTGGGTGGHLYPALAIARALVRQRLGVRAHFIGARRGIERDILPSTEFPHTLLDLHPLYRKTPWNNWRTVIGLVSGWRRVGRLVHEDRPPLVVATGGYASGALLSYSVAHHIPFVLQEQNSVPGQTVRLFSRWARELYLGFPEVATTLPERARPHCVDTGNPIEPPPESIVLDRAARRRVWGFGPDVDRVVLAFGGSQGSAALNALVDAWLAGGLPPRVGLLWATGMGHYARYASRADARVVVRAYLSSIGEAYAVSDVALARAGAMTTAELCAWGIPMVLIPLPTAAADHQTANARALAAAGAAIWFAQSEATVARLDGEVGPLLRDDARLARLAAAARARGRPDAAVRIAERIGALLDAMSS